MTYDSDEACPKCGKHDWWHQQEFLTKDEKHLIVVTHCKRCNTYFKNYFKLVELVGRRWTTMKVKEKASRKVSPYALFVKEKYNEGIHDFADIAKLWRIKKLEDKQ